MNQKQFFFNYMGAMKAISIIGWILVSFGLVLILAIFVIRANFFEPYENYNYKEIEKKGTSQLAKLISISKKENITYNGRNPWVLTYEYSNENRLVKDRFQTINEE